MMMRTLTCNRAALAAALILPLAACAGADMNNDADIHGYQYDAEGHPVAAFVFHGFDERDCAQYSLRPLRDDMAAVGAMFVWDGEEFVLDQDACKPGATPR